MVWGGGGARVYMYMYVYVYVCVGGGGSAWVYMCMFVWGGGGGECTGVHVYVCVGGGGARFYMYNRIISNISTVSNNRTPWGGIQKIKCSVSIISTLCKFIICTGEKNPEMCVSDMNLAWQQASEMRLK